MAKYAYHASHEQFAPSELLKLAVKAEAAGFDAIHSSDHLNPWSSRQGHSGFAFTWVASVLQATQLPVSMICTPGQRYHPVIVAQAIATLAEMYPGRYAVELATGEALNETVTGDGWPSKSERNQRLLESMSVIRKLMKGEEVDHRGLIKVSHARIWSLPQNPPLIYCAAISPETSGWCGSWADGLITTAGTGDETRVKIDAFRGNGGIGKPISVQFSFSFAESRDEAIAAAHHQWRSNLLGREELADTHTTADFDRKTAEMSPEEVAEKLPIITSISELFSEIGKIEDLGVDLISLHNINRNHDFFIDEFSKYAR